MGWIIKIAYKFLMRTPGRTLLTGFGVALGVTLATALVITNISVKDTLDKQIAARYGSFDFQLGYRQNGKYLSHQEVKKISGITGVSSVSKVLIPYVFPIPREVFAWANYWGVESDSPEIKKYKLLQGHYPREGAEAAVTAAFARREKLNIGDNATFPFPPYGNKTVKIVGLLEPPISGGGAPMAFFPLSWVQKTMGLPNQINLIQLRLTKGTNKVMVASNIKDLYPDIEFDLRNYVDKAYKQLNVFQPMVYGLGIIALLTGAVFVMGSFYLSVRSRSDQWAVMRAIGSPPGVIIGILTSEALLVGTMGTFAGIVGGIALSRATSEVIERWFQLEDTGSFISPSILMSLFVAGVFFATLGALFPALTTRNVPPVQAMRLGMPREDIKNAKVRYSGIILMVLGVGIQIVGRFVPKGDGGIPLFIGGLGGVTLCVGLLFSVSSIIALLMSVVAAPVRVLLGIEATMAVRNTNRHRRRAGFAIAILALGFMLALAADIFMNTSLELIKATTKKNMPTDFIVRIPYTAIGYLDPTLRIRISEISGIDKIAAIGTEVTCTLKNFDFRNADPKWLEFADSNSEDPFRRDAIEVYPADTVKLNEMLSLDVVKGKALKLPLKPGEAFMTTEMAQRLGIKLGDQLELEADKTKGPQKIKVISLIQDYPMVRGLPFLFVNLDWGMNVFGSQGLKTIHVNLKPTIMANKVEPQIERLIKNNPSAEYVSYDKAIKEQNDLFSKQLLLIRALIGVVFGIACIGLINAIVSNLHDRRWEMGVIQAIGATPRQLFFMVGYEGMFLGATGGLIGLTGGAIIAFFLIRALHFSKMIFSWKVAGTLLALSLGVGVIASIIAAIWVRRTYPSQTIRIT